MFYKAFFIFEASWGCLVHYWM